jgi:hypothetical protein
MGSERGSIVMGEIFLSLAAVVWCWCMDLVGTLKAGRTK